MKKDKFKIYVLELFLLLILFFALFLSNIFTRSILAIILAVYTIICYKMLKKRNILSIYRKQVIFLMLAFAAIYLIGFYLMGLYFGYYKATVTLSLWSVINYIIPLTIIVVSSEILRTIFLSQKTKSTKWLTLIITVLIDMIIYTRAYDVTRLSDFLTVIGFILFASVSCNLLYNYISTRFGHKPIIIYRLITVLYMYIIPFIPDVFIFFRSFLRMIYPYFIYLILEYTYSKTNLATAYKDKRKSIISTTILVLFTVLIVMLISCKFKYGILVIGSESMTGAINKGDAIIYESYNNQKISEGQIIIYEKGNIQIVHRVVDIKNVNGEYRYYTKGDANEENDEGYVIQEQIVGLTKLRIMYLGYPSLWVKDIFS